MGHNFRTNKNYVIESASLEDYVTNERRLNGIDMSPYGKLICQFEFPKRALLSWSNYEHTNDPSKGSGFNHHSLFVTGNTIVDIPNLHLYDFAQFTYDVDYGCIAEVHIENHTDSSNHLNRFQWIVENENGGLDTSYGNSPTFKFKTNGNYPFKVFAHSTLNDYSELFLDTFHIDSIPSLFPNFQAQDTVVCRYSPVKFHNLSNAWIAQSRSDTSWFWDFGDGQFDSIRSPEHVYEQLGNHAVSLTYTIANCDSTITKSAYITVVDAPKPGFEVKSTVGCIPFSAHFKDTSQYNITNKDYYFSDKGIWLEFPDSLFSYDFGEVGNFYVVQRLFGATGCVTQEDTIWINVKPTISQRQDILVGSYLDNNRIQLQWDNQATAMFYKLFKGSSHSDLQYVTNLTGDTYIDSIDRPAVLCYLLQAVDSCGNNSVIGRESSPILLHAKSVNSGKYAFLEFTSYEKWQDSIITYTIETWTDGHWVPLTEQYDTVFEDQSFLQADKLEKCYRVVAKNTQFSSYSNSVCVPYVPLVFVPTAFSPNGDGVNDQFGIMSFGVKTYQMEIYDRWGGLITTLGTSEKWEAKDAMMGVYIWKLKYTDVHGATYWMSGTLTAFK